MKETANDLVDSLMLQQFNDRELCLVVQDCLVLQTQLLMLVIAAHQHKTSIGDRCSMLLA